MSTYTDTLVDAADALLAGIANDGGATVDVRTGTPVTFDYGYVVSMAGYGWTTRYYGSSAVHEWHVQSFVQQFVNQAAVWISDLTTANPVYVGAWVDVATDTLHLDLSAMFTPLELALTVAREQDQLAIWDVVAGAEIRVTDADIDYSADGDERHPDTYVSLIKTPRVSLAKRPYVRPYSRNARLGNGVRLYR